MPKMPASELKAMLAAEYADALAALTGSFKLSAGRADAMDDDLGDMARDMPAPDGRSRAVSTDVADTIEGLMPSLIEIFCGSDDVVRFNPVGPGDVAAAEQETDYVNHVFMQVNPGFLILYSFIKDALLSKVGVVKVWWEEKTLEERETYYDLTDDMFALLLADPDIEITAHTARPMIASAGEAQEGDVDGDGDREGDGEGEGTASDAEAPPAGVPQLHDVECMRSRKTANARIEPVPPEEFGIARNARSLRDCDYCFHKVLSTEGKLLAQGFDEAQVKALPSYAGITNTEEIGRDTVQEHQLGGDSLNTAGRRIEVTENYVRMDYERNGKPCLYKVTTFGRQGELALKDGKPDIEPFDAIPFAAMTPVIITHRFFGRSIADLVMDIQRIKTAVLRGILDNTYLANNPRVEVAETHASADTLDDLLVSRPGGIVRTKQPGGLSWQVVPSIAGAAFPVMEYMDATREIRTGVTRQGQGINADALQNQSATAVNQMFTAAQARIRLIARIFAETGIKDLFTLVHAIIRKHGQARETVQLRKQWVTVNPREWKTRNDMTIHVGLGTGGRQEQAALSQGILNIQKAMLSGGLTQLVQPKNLYAAAQLFCRAAGHKDGDAFFTDPDAKGPNGLPLVSPPQPQPSPEMLRAQADQQAQQGQLAIAAAKTKADGEHQVMKTQAEMALDLQKFEHEKQLALMNHGLAAERHRMEMTAKAVEIAAKSGGVGPDGQAQPVDLDGLIGKLATLNPPAAPQPKGMRIVRDAAGRVSHAVPIE
jgi:hypothetical protein